MNNTNVKEVTVIYGTLSEHFAKLAKNQTVFNNYRKEMSKIFEKNERVLHSDLVGKQLLINKNEENSISKILDHDPKTLSNAYENSEYFQQFEGDLKRKDMLLFIIPQVIYALELAKAKKKEQSEFVYFCAFLKPYASRISAQFPYGITDGQMRYTIENDLNNRFDIKRLGTVYSVLLEKSKISYENYFVPTKDKFTDSLLYDIIVSGITSRISSSLKLIAGKYYENKGKYLEYERTAAMSSAEDSSGEVFDVELRSNSAVKKDIIRKALMKMATNPIDDKLVNFSYKIGYGLTRDSKTFFNTTKVAVTTITKNKKNDLEVLFDAILTVFLESKSEVDIKNARIYLGIILQIAKTSNSKEPTIVTIKEKIKNFLEEHSSEYITYKSDTNKRNLEKSCLVYFAMFLQQSIK